MSWVSESVRAVTEYLPLILVILIIGVIIKILMDIAERFGKGKLASIIPLPLLIILTTIFTFICNPAVVFAVFAQTNSTNSTVVDISTALGPIIPLFIGMIMLLIVIILILKMLESILRH